jgi:NAD(P)-dependent dehydrogenase (short-subunit alcohol dehydrogenase family)
MIQDLRGLSAVVTGGGDGIGRAIALNLAGLGMNLAILDIREDAARRTAEDCEERGARALALGCDASVEEEIDAAAEAARRALGPIALVSANAGVGIAGGLTTAPRAALRWMFSVNVDGLIDTIRAFVPQMKQEAGWRRILITGSMAGLVQVADGGPSAYGATKYAAVGIAEALRAELVANGIGVTLFCPGTVDTRIWGGARARPERFGGPSYAPEAAGQRWRETGMNVDEVAAIAVEGLRSNAFYVLVPESAARAARLGERAEALTRAIRMTRGNRQA